jgi:thiol-disulfide isomerase/thioredoxin
MISARRSAVIAARWLVAAITAVSITACGNGGSHSAAKAAAADVTVTAADGSPTTLAKLKGTPLVVNMWATWCHPCVTEMPAFDTVASSIGSGVRILGVNVADDAAAASAFAAKLGVHYPQYTDPDGNLSTAFDVSNLPATAFIGADGTVLEVHSGAYTADTLKAAIEHHFPGTTGGTSK